MGTKKKKGPSRVSPRGKKIETEIANERMNRAGDDDDGDDDDGKHTKNTYLLTRKERKRKTPKCIQYANNKSWQQSRISYLPEVSRDIHETFCNCQVKISLGSIIHDSSESFLFASLSLSLLSSLA